MKPGDIVIVLDKKNGKYIIDGAALLLKNNNNFNWLIIRVSDGRKIHILPEYISPTLVIAKKDVGKHLKTLNGE